MIFNKLINIQHKLTDNQIMVFYVLSSLVIFLLFLKIKFQRNDQTREIKISNAQIIGKRKEQEDSFSTLKTDDGVLATVADGMGGLAYGKKASNLAVQTFIESFAQLYGITSINQFLTNTTYIINKKILELSGEVKLGTTLITALINNNYLYWVSVGDSYLYLYRDNEIKLINKIHTYSTKLKQKYQAGEISREEMFNNPKKNMLTSYLGYEGFHEMDYSKTPLKLMRNDIIILCSDGIYKGISESELENILEKRYSLDKYSEKIIELLDKKNSKNQDNATVIIMKIY